MSGHARTAIAELPLEEIGVIRDNGWRRLEWVLAGTPISAQRLLAMNADLPGREKLCVDDLGRPVLRIELPEEGDDVERRITQARADMCRTITHLGRLVHPAPDPGGEDKIPDVPALCAEAGWPCIERAPAIWVVDLPDMPMFCQAEITLTDGALRICVPLGSEPADEMSRTALVHLLARACGAFRMIRACGPPYRLLIRLPLDPIATDFPHALAALSVGARALFREVAALRDPALARTFCGFQPSAPSTGAPTGSETDQGQDHA